MRFNLLCLLILSSACSMAQSVEGTVFDAATGAGAPGVKVELLKQATPFYETVTDGGGHFRFDDIREADYALRYQSPDYWLTAGPSDYKAFHVAAGSPVKVEARLMPWSKISGRVVDGRGNGVADARVELTGSGMMINGRTYLRSSWGGGGGGQLSMGPMGMGQMGNADAQGKFEVQVMPGAYGLSVFPPPGLKPPDPEKNGPPRAWVRTYYPGVADPEAASNLVVLPGSEVADVELKLLAIPTHAVRGVVVNPDGTPAPKVTVAIGEAFSTTTFVSKPDGAFEFPAVAEGEWRVSAEAQRGAVKLRAVEWIDVKGHDLENVKLRLAAPLMLRGNVIVVATKDAAPKDTPAPRPGPMMLSLLGGRNSRNGDLGPMGTALFNLNSVGNFVVEGVYPGVYRLSPILQPPSPPYYLDAVLIGGADLTTQEVEISSDATISVVYRADGGSVLGKAENCASGGVLLVPVDPARRRPGFSRSGPCDSSGHYEVHTVRPGDYYALAFAGNGPVLAVDESLLGQGVKVTVRAGEASLADLKAVTRPVF